MESYCNPVPFSDGKRYTDPDPYILRWCGKYYCYATDEAGVKVSVSEDMVHWGYRGFAIAEEEYHHYWAPSVIYLNGMFYMYYSNIPVEEEDCHEQHLKLAVSEDPFGPFVYQKTFFEKFSIDSHPVVRNGELYMFYSVNDWIGLDSKVAGTCILLDKMVTPEEFAGEPKAVVTPSLPQEIYAENRFGDGRDWYTIEGACPVFHGDKCWMLYSANAYKNIYYFVGTAVAEIKEDLLDMAWKKYPDDHTWMPLLKKNQVVEGTGHNTVTKAPNLFEDWIVYHGRDIEEGLHQGTEQRNMRIDPLLYFGDRMFCPGPSYQERPVPGRSFYTGRDIRAEKDVFFAEAKEFYRMEVWCSVKMSHAGAKYRIYLDCTDQENYIALELHSGQRKAVAVCCRRGIEADIAEITLPIAYNFSVPCMISVERKKNCFRVMFHEDSSMEFRAGAALKTGKIGAGGCFTPLTIHSVAVSEGAELRGKELFFLSEFYDCSGAEIKNGALQSPDGTLRFTERNAGNCVTEVFQWKVQRKDHQVELYCGNEKLCAIAGGKDTVTFYYHRGSDGVYVLTDGQVSDTGEMKMTDMSGITCLAVKGRKECSLGLTANGAALQEYTRIM